MLWHIQHIHCGKETKIIPGIGSTTKKVALQCSSLIIYFALKGTTELLLR